MKLKMEIETEPEELRKFLGLPDVSGLQSELIQMIRNKMQEGLEGFDPVSLLRPYLPENLQSLQALQKEFWNNVWGSHSDKASTPGKKQNR